jgi:hypothetical protein
VAREGTGQVGEGLACFYVQPEENMADFRSVVSQGLLGSGRRRVSKESRQASLLTCRCSSKSRRGRRRSGTCRR